jgi:hypothetical protein
MALIKKYSSLIAVLLGTSLFANAEVIPVYQIDQAAGSYVQTTLTHDIYRYSGDAQLNDLVVTDAQGNKLPYRITAPSTQVSEQSQQTQVRFFPVAVGTAPEMLLALSSASIRLDDNEISVSVVKNDKEELQNQAVPTDFFVVDLSDLKTRADKLVVSWPQSEAHQYLEVQASGTNDMSTWAPIANTTLVQLFKDGQQLTRNKIAINLTEKQYAYVKLKFTRGGEQLQLTQVAIENTDKIATAAVPDRWEINGQLAEDQESALRGGSATPSMPVAAWEFQRDDIAPVAKLDLQLGELTYGDSLRVYSRATEKQPWQLVHQGIWFNTQVGTDWQHSDEISIYNNSHNYWRVELNELVRTSAKPVLVFQRQPELLQFIANTSAPFKIAIETDSKLQNQNTSAQIFSQLISGKEITWQSTTFNPLNPNLNQFARHGMQISWKTIVFWGILILAVGVLIGVVVRLMGQMKTARE